MKWLSGALLVSVVTLSGCSVLSTQDPRDVKQHWQDQKIEIYISDLANDEQYTNTLSVNSIALDDAVVLVGQATSPSIKQQFGEQVQRLPHVKHVYNQIRVHPLLSFRDISYDAWLTTKVKSQLIGSKKLTNVVIKVISENGEVFLLGYLSPQQGEVAASIARNVSGVRKVVTLFESPSSKP